MTFRFFLRAISIVALLSLPHPVFCQSWQDLLAQAELLTVSGQSDSARVLFHLALTSAESGYTQSDSTVDIVFYPDGVRTPVYFSSYVDAEQAYTQLLSSAELIFAQDDSLVSNILLKSAEVKRVLGKYYEAEPLITRALSIREKQFGPVSAETAAALDALGMAHYYLGRYPEAATFCDSGLTMRENLLGAEHPSLIRSCLNLAFVIIKLDYYDGAEQLSRRAAAIAEAVFGSESLQMADCHERIGLALYFAAKEVLAEPEYLRSLEIRRRHLRPDHPEIATILLRLANLYRYLDQRYAECDSLLEQSLKLRERVFGPDHPEVAEVLYYMEMLYRTVYKDFARAEEVSVRALNIREKSLGFNHPETAESHYFSGTLYHDLFQFEKAEYHLKQSLAIYETVYGAEHPRTFMVVTGLYKLFENQGRYAEALPVAERRLKLAAQFYGPDHQLALESIDQQAIALWRLGRFDEAEKLMRQVLAGYEELYGPVHAKVADALSALAVVLESQTRYKEAAELLERALPIADLTDTLGQSVTRLMVRINLGIMYQSLGRLNEAESLYLAASRIMGEQGRRESDMFAICLLNLGLLYEAQGRYHEADSVLRLSIEIGERVLGPQNPGLAHALNNLGNLYKRLGRYDEAIPIQERAVGILEGALGPEHPEVAKFRRDLGRLYAYAGVSSKSLESYNRFIDWSQRYLENVFPYSSEEQKLRWIDAYPLIDHTLFSLALKDGALSSQRLSLEMLLKSKAMVIEAVMAEKQAAFCHYDDVILSQMEQLSEIHTQIASLSMAGSYYIDSVASLYKVKDSLEVVLSRHCSEFSDALAARRFETKDIIASIPSGSVLWEFVRYQPTDLSMKVAGDAKLGPPRYLAFTVDGSGSINIKDLGPAQKIDSLIAQVRGMIYKAQSQIYSVAAKIAEERLNEVTGQLYAILFEPLLADKTDIYVSPDGMLNLLPFEILPMPDGSYAIERYRISYLSSGRDLLKLKGSPPSEGEILVMADPDFDGTASKARLSDEFFGPQMRGNTACLSRNFNPLPYSRTEASSVVDCFRTHQVNNVREFYGNLATEGLLKNMNFAPRVVHLATHGFFCEGTDSSHTLLDNPLLRSGLVLTGANRTISGNRADSTDTDDGILTALEVSGLNLVGTDLAVLSACESGVGDLVNGEGLFGLRRAFQHAGVHTIIMSLWSVPDRETSRLMEGFYRRWLGGKTKGDSLRESALDLLNQSRAKRGCAHPLLWGGFILAGNPN